MATILITGFAPFGGESINPSFQAVSGLPATINGWRVEKREIPVVFGKAVDAVEQAIDQSQAEIIIAVGQAGGRFAVTPERVAINVDDARIADNDGNRPIDQAIVTGGAPAFFSSLPVKSIVEAIKAAGIPASLSNSAGTYVCNHLMYGLLHLIANKYGGKKRGGFIHVPYLPSQVVDKHNTPSLSLAAVTMALKIAASETINRQNDIKAALGTIC